MRKMVQASRFGREWIVTSVNVGSDGGWNFVKPLYVIIMADVCKKGNLRREEEKTEI